MDMTMSNKLKKFIGKKCILNDHTSFSAMTPIRLDFVNVKPNMDAGTIDEVGEDYVTVKVHDGTRQLMHLTNIELIF